jgi:hypothetical protein
VLGLLVGALLPALTRLLGATRAGITGREINDRAFRMYRMYMSNPRRRYRRPLGDDRMTSSPHQEVSQRE